MELSVDFLEVARHLAGRDARKPKQANLRRAVSSAYYALFHLLVKESSRRWRGSDVARLGLARSFEHSKMKQACGAFMKPNWMGFDGQNTAIPLDLRQVSATFRSLQRERHEADYDASRSFTRIEVQSLVAETEQAFRNWPSISAHPAADSFLIALLTGDRRRD